MTITQITVHASHSFNDPGEAYANWKPGVTLTATVEPGEDIYRVHADLQANADALVCNARQAIWARRKREIAEVEAEYERHQEAKRKEWERMSLLGEEQPRF